MLKRTLLLSSGLMLILAAGCRIEPRTSIPQASSTATALPWSAPEGAARGEWLDLTHEFSAETVYWPTAEPFKLDVVSEGMTPKGYYYSAYQFCAAEHGGTHIDAPVHFAQGHPSIDKVPLDRLMGPGAVVDVTAQAESDRDYLISVDDIRKWEESNGTLQPGTILLLRTGFERFWPDRAGYLGTAARGQEAVKELHFPGLSPSAARWLVQNRKIAAVGLDTASIDYGQSQLFESHRALFAADIPAMENLANLDRLPPKGAWIIALPMKIKGGSGAPLRAIAYVP